MNLFEDLAWLPRPMADFSAKLKAANSALELRSLAQHALDDNQLRKLSKKYRQIKEADGDLSSLASVSLGLLSNATTKMMIESIQATSLRFGIAATIMDAPFNHVAQEAFSDDSFFADSDLDVLLIALDYRGLPIQPCPGVESRASKNVQECLAYLDSLIGSLHKKTSAQIILQNIVPPVELLAGSFERRLPGSLSWLIHQINIEIEKRASPSLLVLDVLGLAERVGLSNWHDPTLWNIGKLPFSPKYLPVYADYICRLLAARRGKSRRCLILDLDNTLWGGVIGDDGLDGILIGNGDPTGEAHLHLQRTVLALRDRGIVLAVSSKNEDATARLPFRSHPDMLLKESHIAVFQANWLDKATNIREIAKTLSLGLESLVFLDDNPVERMQVRRELPQVAIPELPEDPAEFSRYLIAAGYFEAITFSDEDQKRAEFYQNNAKRIEILNQSSDMHSYLVALDMEITLSKFDQQGRTRITQLISKSNQFNLTSKRYTEPQIAQLENSEKHFTRQVRLKDVLGDNGMISVVICEKHSDRWKIDTWLMSCRVLGRRVEEAILQDLVNCAKVAGVDFLEGEYIPSSRNNIVQDHYKKLGFALKEVRPDGVHVWVMQISSYEPISLPMKFIYPA